MNSSCPTCGTTYRVDPAKVPQGGIRARCIKCEAIFRVVDPQRAEPIKAPQTEAEAQPPEPAALPPSPAPTPASSAPVVGSTPAPAFGVADPDSKARRLARALISDIVVYHPERREESLRTGNLRQEFRDEIRKSWEEYVAQVGDSVARATPYFRDALNEILAGGQPLF